MREYIQKAKILIEALPYIKEFAGITVVIKYGGSALINEEIKTTVIQDIALMKFVGLKPVVVHGGGPDINTMLKRLNIKSEFVAGMRVTDDAALEVVEMVLAGKLNKAITMQLSMQGVRAAGISGKDGNMLRVSKAVVDGKDIGWVGDVRQVDTTLIRTLIDNDYVPVISPIGFDEQGRTYNVNADYAAVAVAGALGAQKLVFLTDVEGVMRDLGDSGSVFSRLRLDEIKEMIANGIVSGGMIPKLECCVAGVEAGVRHVHILDGRVEHSLILEIFTQEGVGTLIER
ncbi:MAG: acetylglutamate kinase [Clostridiales bacterium]|jgi:acetylglutamate kinase|nr:acetylglutamate kinase [Clostridiales bacterium]